MRKAIVYADNAATTPMSEKAVEAMSVYLRTMYANASQPYAFAREPKKALKQARETIARCIGARSPEEIVFTSCGTESDNWVIENAWLQHRHIHTSCIEHHAILNASAFAQSLGAKVDYIPVNRDGIVELKELSGRLCEGDLVSVMLANNEIGTIEPVAEIARMAHEHGCIFHTDAVQAVGHIPVNVQELGVDLLSASGHKFNGPKGVGFLYKRQGIRMTPLINGGAQESGLRAGTENVAAIVAMAAALEENVSQLDMHIHHITRLENLLMGLLEASGISYHRNGAARHTPGNISISFPNADGEAILHRLDFLGICVSTGSACNSKSTQISHVLKAIGLENSLAKGTIRITLGKNNTEEDILQIASAIKSILFQKCF